MPTDPAKARERALKGAKKESGGNTRADANWFRNHEGELEVPDLATKPPGFLYQINYQWTYFQDDLLEEEFEPYRQASRSGIKCSGTAYVRDQSGMYIVDADWERLTRPCLGRVARGGKVCHAHGAKIPQVKAAAEQRLAEAAEIVALRLVGLTETRDELQEAIDHKVRLAAANSVLDRVGIRGGTTVEVTGTGFERVLDSLFGAPESDDA